MDEFRSNYKAWQDFLYFWRVWLRAIEVPPKAASPYFANYNTRRLPIVRRMNSYFEDVYNMAQKKRESNANWTAIEFVSCTLSAEDKKAFTAWHKQHANDWFSLLTDLVGSGYKFTLSEDATNDCFIASVTCKEERNPNVNKCLSARSNDAAEAMALLMFKHHVLSDNGIWLFESAANNWG